MTVIATACYETNWSMTVDGLASDPRAALLRRLRDDRPLGVEKADGGD